MRFLICRNDEGGLTDWEVGDADELIQDVTRDRRHFRGEEMPIRRWADRAAIGDRYNYSKGVIIAVSGRVTP